MLKTVAWLLLVGVCLLQPVFASNYRLKVTSWSCQTFSKGAIVRGVVQNISNRTLSDIRAHVQVVGAGLRVTVNSALLQDRSLAPGQRSSFTVRLSTSFEPNRCNLWFRNAQVVQIETLVPPPR